MFVKVGTYTGNGSSQSITGVGFTPKAVWVKALANQQEVYRLDTMPAGESKANGTSAFISDGITALGSDGFTVGASARVNANTTTYYYIAIGGSDVFTDTWSGTSATNARTGAGFQPEAVMACTPSQAGTVIKTSAMSGTDVFTFGGGTPSAATMPSLDSDGFTVGNSSLTNTTGNTYYAVALNNSTGFKVQGYTGNGSTQNITGVGFNPAAVLAKRHNGALAQLRTSFHASTNSSYMGVALNTISNGVTGLIADGFSVGAAADTNGNTFAFSALAFIDNAPAGNIELAGVATLAIDAAAAMNPLRALLGVAELSIDATGAAVRYPLMLSGVADIVITGEPAPLLSGALQELAGVAELSVDAAAALGVIRALAGEAELSVDAMDAELTSLILIALAGVAEVAITGAGALSIPIRSLAGVAELVISATSNVYNPDAEDGSDNGEEPGGGLAVSRFPQHWRALRVGDIVNAITPNAGVGGTSPVLRLLELTAESGATDADCTWQYYEETTEPTLSRNLGAAKPFSRERLPRALADALRKTNQADGRRRG